MLDELLNDLAFHLGMDTSSKHICAPCDAWFGCFSFFVQRQAPHTVLPVHTAELSATAACQAAQASSCLRQRMPGSCCSISKGTSAAPYAEPQMLRRVLGLLQQFWPLNVYRHYGCWSFHTSSRLHPLAAMVYPVQHSYRHAACSQRLHPITGFERVVCLSCRHTVKY